MTGSIEKIDLALLDIKWDVEQSLDQQHVINEAAIAPMLDRFEKHLPEVWNFRIASADGLLIVGDKVVKSDRVSIADRDYFTYHLLHDDGSLQTSKPIVGRVVNAPIITLGRRLNYPDGTFAGIVYATIGVDYFNKLLSSFDLGPHGTITLRDRDLGLITRWPLLPGIPASQLGNRQASPELQAQAKSGAVTGTILNAHGADGIGRIITYRRLAVAPIMVVAGVASQDYLTEFGNALYLDLAIAFSFSLLSAFFAYMALRLINRAQATELERDEVLARMRKIASRIPGMVYQFQLMPDGSSRFPFASGAIQDIFQVTPNDVREDASRALAAIHAEDHDRVLASIQVSARDLTPWKQEFRTRFRDGIVHWLFCNAIPQREQDGSVLWHGFMADITERVEASHTLEKLVIEQHAILNSHIMGIAKLNKRNIVWSNEAFASFVGYTPDELQGQSTRILYVTEEEYLAFGTHYTLFLAGNVVRTEVQFKRKDGSIGWYEIGGGLLRPDSDESIWALADITERKHLESMVQQMAFYDPLTNLPNRRMLSDRLTHALSSTKRSGLYGALMFIDLDNFKPLNDTYGHDAGDLLLIEVGRRLQTCVREVDTVARVGGDEFVVMVNEIDKDQVRATAQTAIIAEKVRVALAEPYSLRIEHAGQAGFTTQHYCTASIGIVVFPQVDGIQDDLMKWADAAMYQAKVEGRNRIQFFKMPG